MWQGISKLNLLDLFDLGKERLEAVDSKVLVDVRVRRQLLIDLLHELGIRGIQPLVHKQPLIQIGRRNALARNCLVQVRVVRSSCAAAIKKASPLVGLHCVRPGQVRRSSGHGGRR